MSLKKIKDTKFKDKGMVLLGNKSFFPLLVSKDDLCSLLGWDSTLLY